MHKVRKQRQSLWQLPDKHSGAISEQLHTETSMTICQLGCSRGIEDCEIHEQQVVILLKQSKIQRHHQLAQVKSQNITKIAHYSMEHLSTHSNYFVIL